MATVEITLDEGETAPEVGDRVTISGEVMQLDPLVVQGTVAVSEDETMAGDTRREQARRRGPMFGTAEEDEEI